MAKKSNLTVTPRKKESAERMIKRFIRTCKKKGIIDEVKDRRYFKSKSQKRNETKRKRKRAIAKAKEKDNG
jgi:ribosomal protein S21|tara:strand:- start:3144 stop:3356 length:213 start_codon:yes stop_codon:yes gene_type:complete